MDPTNLLLSPGKIALASDDFFSEGNIQLTYAITRADRNVSAFGTMKRPVTDKMVSVTFTPTQFDNLTALFPYGSTKVGTSIFGGSDVTCVITPINGAPLTLANAAITQMPSISLSAGGSQFGQCTITGLLATDDDATTLADYLAFGSPATGASLTGFDASKLINAAYTATYNSVTYYSGVPFVIDFGLNLIARPIEGLGTVDYVFGSVTPTCTFRPEGITEANYQALTSPFATAIGKEPTRYDLTIAGPDDGDPEIVLDNCECGQGSMVYGTDPRLGAVTFRGARAQTTGAVDAAFTVGVVSS